MSLLAPFENLTSEPFGNFTMAGNWFDPVPDLCPGVVPSFGED
ncbi:MULTISPECIES: hypothetical protein [Actinotignum]|uniref:Uncharacterized protein n=1 Tax=Actinotignum timonense TaxID=1870995 RepID=A0AAW9HAZ8_9ACTO|nr:MULTISPECIES: hypothetical protein [Actinotignum]MDE1559184.1 hypothetical protein [Actinotignum schaalii]MDE1664195.1 hypothetical protein [Actinotignum schaalii]MDK6372524.1 hypothetical protein [Actinotignum timonense]MDK6418831.1 hypothetical protein [Actinotignum timonense]MDK6630381.1 hypothetical protein [Actinotignum timonense]